MSRIGISQTKQAEIASLLSAALQEPVNIQEFDQLVKGRVVPSAKIMSWTPEVCLETKGAIFLVHQLIEDIIPMEVKQGRSVGSSGKSHHKHSPKLIPVVFCPDTGEITAVKRAELIIEDCASAGCVLICDSSSGAVLILPPDFRVPMQCRSELESGHIPTWLFDALLALDAFSDYFRKTLGKVHRSYLADVRHGSSDYDTEAEVLIRFLQDLRRGDQRLFMPLDRFNALKSWERANANVKSRDHFFHTVNNLLLGFLILGYIFEKADRLQAPESFVRQPVSCAKLLTWESLWFLTCINHDPAYSAEHFWANYAYSIGISGTATTEPIPDEAVQHLVEAWDTAYKGARQDLSELYNAIRGKWDPPQLIQHVPAFDRALREAYWNGTKSSHSLISGLMLINGCVQDRAAKSKHYDETIALKACDIAALSMMFHDQHCRHVLASNGVEAISFDILPYAAVLMFVDSLQDDRRDISKMEFASHGILNSITYDRSANEVIADVCLAELPIKFWPSKIVEYESATRWINTSSRIHFKIDYKSRISVQDSNRANGKSTLRVAQKNRKSKNARLKVGAKRKHS